jgi:hypothetical protein
MLALVGGMGDLVQVAADAPKLADGALRGNNSSFGSGASDRK